MFNMKSLGVAAFTFALAIMPASADSPNVTQAWISLSPAAPVVKASAKSTNINEERSC
jgi:hypothetical protein